MIYNKVEICGINTSKLPVISEKRKQELLHIIKNGNSSQKKKARDEMINGNLRLVLSVVQRFNSRGENPDDLFQVGCIGLIKAIDNFNCTKDVCFSTYGVPMIIGEIRRYLRDYNPIRVSRSLRDTAYHAMNIKERFTIENNREPTVDEIAKEMNISKENIIIALESIIDPISLYEPVFSDDNDTIYVIDQLSDINNSSESWINKLAIKQAVDSLEEREKTIFLLRFFKGKTQTEVAHEIGISQAQISRLEKAALTKIKNEL